MTQPSDFHINKGGDYAITISTAKMPFIAAGLVNSALAALLSQLSIRFFELAFFPEKCAAVRSAHLRREVPVTISTHPVPQSSVITTPLNHLIKPEPLNETHLTASDVLSSPRLCTSMRAYKLENIGGNNGNECLETQPAYPAEHFRNTNLHSDNSSILLSHNIQFGVYFTPTETPRPRKKRASRGRTMHPCTFANCDRKFLSETALNTHINLHTGERPFACEVPGCGCRFRDKTGLKRHNQVHLDKSSRQCIQCPYPGCERKFIRPANARGHLNNHLGLKPYECDYPGCSRTFSHSSGLIHHKKQHDLPEVRPQIACPHPGCDRKFLHRSSLRDHQYAHWKNQLFPCDSPGCTMTFYRPSQLKTHKKTHLPKSQPKRIRCKYAGCDATFSYYNLLRIHCRISHGRPKLMCQFPGCTREFTLEDNRRSHYRTHLKWLHEKDPQLDAERVLAMYPFLPDTVKRRVSQIFSGGEHCDQTEQNC